MSMYLGLVKYIMGHLQRKDGAVKKNVHYGKLFRIYNLEKKNTKPWSQNSRYSVSFVGRKPK